jgi:methylenetetrahydrofolate dehydrogenase (NADP+)/methenyltetrahydrofolate cyclohydrolase
LTGISEQDLAETRIIDGKAFAARLLVRMTAEVAALPRPPGLAVVLVGNDPASQVYVRNKARTTMQVGMRSFEFVLPAETPEPELLELIAGLNADADVHGILVQLPLPGHLSTAAVIAAIDPDKDVDGLHVINAGRLAAGLPGLAPCTPLGCLLLLKDALGDMAGMNAVVVGRSNLVGKPVAQLLLQENCTVTIAHSKSRDLPGICRGADILVAAVGRPEMVRGGWIKPGATVIDVGINRVAEKKLLGDVAFDEALGIAGQITPVPGGVGPMTIACLLQNTLTAAKRIEGARK